MQKNVGTLDALLRIMWGLVGIAWGTSRMVLYPTRSMPMLVTLFSAMKVAEGITRWCPLLQAFDLTTIEKKINRNTVIEKEADQQVVQPVE